MSEIYYTYHYKRIDDTTWSDIKVLDKEFTLTKKRADCHFCLRYYIDSLQLKIKDLPDDLLAKVFYFRIDAHQDSQIKSYYFTAYTQAKQNDVSTLQLDTLDPNIVLEKLNNIVDTYELGLEMISPAYVDANSLNVRLNYLVDVIRLIEVLLNNYEHYKNLSISFNTDTSEIENMIYSSFSFFYIYDNYDNDNFSYYLQVPVLEILKTIENTYQFYIAIENETIYWRALRKLQDYNDTFLYETSQLMQTVETQIYDNRQLIYDVDNRQIIKLIDYKLNKKEKLQQTIKTIVDESEVRLYDSDSNLRKDVLFFAQGKIAINFYDFHIKENIDDLYKSGGTYKIQSNSSGATIATDKITLSKNDKININMYFDIREGTDGLNAFYTSYIHVYYADNKDGFNAQIVKTLTFDETNDYNNRIIDEYIADRFGWYWVEVVYIFDGNLTFNNNVSYINNNYEIRRFSQNGLDWAIEHALYELEAVDDKQKLASYEMQGWSKADNFLIDKKLLTSSQILQSIERKVVCNKAQIDNIKFRKNALV